MNKRIIKRPYTQDKPSVLLGLISPFLQHRVLHGKAKKKSWARVDQTTLTYKN